MKKKKRSWYGYIVFGVIFLVQTTTYLTLGPEFLKLQILPDYFTSLNHQSDSLYVKDFYTTSQTSTNRKYFSIHLKKEENLLKKKFKVKNIRFENKETFNKSGYKNYKLYYETYANRSPWYTLFGFFSVRQTELLVVDERFVYTRETSHIWILFFWIKTYDFFTIESFDKAKLQNK